MSSAFGPGERESASGVAARASVPRALITTTVYVIDTSVLLADPLAVTRFAEHEVVVPLVVLTELEGKRHHPELGWAARRCAPPARGPAHPARIAASSRCR